MSARTESANQILFDNAVTHFMETRRYEATLAARQDSVVAKHSTSVRESFLRNPRASLAPLYASFSRRMQQLGVKEVGGFLADEIDFHHGNLNSATKNFYPLRRPSKRAVTQSFLKQGIFSGLPLGKQYAGITSSALSSAEAAIKRGLVEGLNQREILANLQKTVDVSGNQARALLRTSMTQAETTALQAVAKENPEILQGLEYTAILDSKTSSICSSLNGTIFPPEETASLPPRHFNCRSSVVPVLKSRDEMLSGDRERFRVRKLSNVSSTVLSGAPSRKESFGEWLREQPFDTKRRHLGSEEKVALFDQGSLDVSDFFTSAGAPLDLKTLKLESSRRTFGLFQGRRSSDEDALLVKNSRQLLNNPNNSRQLRQLYIDDSTNASQPLSLVDYRGTTLGGKREVRRRTHNVFDERNNYTDPMTGESGSNLFYNPDFEVFRERMDFMQNSKLLTAEQKDYIERTVASLDDKVSRNQQTAVIENLRVVLERINRNPGEEWGNFATVLRNEMRFSVQNTSRILDRRSRARAQLFDTGTDGTGAVYILGERYTFDDLTSRYRSDLRLTDDWLENVGRSYARSAYYGARSPMRLYMERINPISARSVSEALRKVNPLAVLGESLSNLLRTPRRLRSSVDDLLQRYYYRNKEGFFQEAVRRGSESLARILDFELSFNTVVRPSWSKQLNRVLRDNKAIDSLANIFKLVASGRSTDYDSLAIAIGKQFTDDFKLEYPFLPSTLKSQHQLGSEFLQGMVKSGQIKVETRGVVRRAVLDVDTGRPSSAFKDTVSREVTVLDDQLLELQRASRRLQISNRLGITGPENDLIPRRGSLSFYDPTGRKTSQTILTTNASKHFDPRSVDSDVVDFVKKGMSLEYETDPEFATFMERLLRFRDPRGNVDYYDELNSFRQVILQRGEQGEGLMQTVRWHNSRAKPFRARAQIDGRGRLYFNGYLQPTGGEMVRPFLNTAKSAKVTPAGVDELVTHLGSLLGSGEEALTQAGRRAIFKRNEDSLLELGRILQSTTQRDRRTREFLEHPIIRELEGEEIPIVARFALEYKRFHDHTGGRVYDAKALEGLETKLLSEIDASASAVQIISLATGNRNMATVSNVLQTRQKNRIYDIVAMDTKSDPRYLAIEERIGVDLSWEELAKGSKAAVMLAGYGSGRPGIAAAVSDKLQSLLGKKGLVVTTRKELNAELRNINRMIKNADDYDMETASKALTQLREELVEAVNGETTAVRNAVELARDYSPDTARFLERLQATRSGLVSPDDFTQIANIMVDHLESRAPGANSYINWFKQLAVSFIEDSGSVAIPLRTFDKKNWWLRFRPEQEHEVRFFDPKSRRYIRNIVRGQVEDDAFDGKMSIVKARTGYGVSFTHANDAAILRLVYKKADRANIGIASVHDAIVGNLEDMAPLKQFATEAYAEARSARVLQETLESMRKNGLSRANYLRLKKMAEDTGLFNDEFSASDILEVRGGTYDNYGWGP